MTVAVCKVRPARLRGVLSVSGRQRLPNLEVGTAEIAKGMAMLLFDLLFWGLLTHIDDH